MAYSKDGKIEASDINDLTTSINSTLTSLGQTNLPSVSQYNTVAAVTWQNLITTTRNIASHQNTVTSTLPDTSVTVANGKRVNYYSIISTKVVVA